MLKQTFASLYRGILSGIIELIYYSFLIIPIMFYSESFLFSIVWLLLLLVCYSCYSIMFSQRKPTYWHVSLHAIVQTLLTTFIVSFTLTLSTQFTILLLVLVAVFTLWFSISGFRQSKLSFSESFSVTFMGLTILGHLVLQILKITWLKQLVEVNLLLYSAGILAIILTLFLTNERMLADQQKLLGKSSAQQQALKMNRVLISLLSLIALAVIAFRQWQEALEAATKTFIGWFLSLFNREPKQETQADEALREAAMPFGQAEQGEPSALLLFLEKLLVIVAYILLVIAIIAVLVLLFKMTAKLMRKLLLFLKGKATIGIEDTSIYIDEVEQLEKSSKRKQARGRSLFKKKLVWTSLTYEQKCYQLYIMLNQLVARQGHNYIKHFSVQEQIFYITAHYKLELNTEELFLLERLYDYAKYGKAATQLLGIDGHQLDKLYVKLNERK